jgi:hypothetical protein
MRLIRRFLNPLMTCQDFHRAMGQYLNVLAKKGAYHVFQGRFLCFVEGLPFFFA